MNLGEIRRTMAPLYGGDPRMVIPVTPERALFNEVLQAYAEAPNNTTITDATIISEAILPTATGTKEIIFNVRADQQNPTNVILPSEARLDMADAMVVDQVTVMFANVLTADLALNPGAPGNAQWQTFPNNAAVAASAAAPGGFAANAAGIRQAYNGVLKMAVNSVEFVDSIDAHNFLFADMAQAGALLATGGTIMPWGADSDRHFKRVTPSYNLWGSDKVQFRLVLPQAFTFGVASNTVCARFMARGLKIQGGARYKN